MKIGIAGLGLIGGSLAKAYKNTEENTVYGYDIDDAVLGFAALSGAIDGVLDESVIAGCDGIFIALRPQAAIEYLEQIAPFIKKDTLVIDCCGVKRYVCEKCFDTAKHYGFTFVGGHPMAGIHNSGFKYSKAGLFKGAPMVLVPPVYDDISLFERIEDMLKPVGFGKLTITTAEKHDDMIAFSSQMAHIVSNAYIKSPTAREHKGFSAGSYKDLTRVAWLNAPMWSELFIENQDTLLREIDIFIEALCQYKEALADGDGDKLTKLLEEGSRIKEEVDGRS